MLKLMKYEFIHSMRTYFIAFIAFLGCCIALPFVFQTLRIEWLNVIFGLGFMTLLMGIWIGLLVSIFTRYYSSMFKRAGYLTLTLPVSSFELVLSKALTCMLWLVIGLIVMIIGLGIFSFIMLILSEKINMMEALTTLFQLLYKDVVNIMSFHLLWLNALTAISYLLSLIGVIYFSLTVVQTKYFPKWKPLFTTIILLVIYLCMNQLTIQCMDIFYTKMMGLGLLCTAFISVGIVLLLMTSYIVEHHIEVK